MSGPKQAKEPEIPRHPDDDRMREEVKGDELYTKKEARIHPWVYTIIPLKALASIDVDYIIFTAYCKACRSYFTEVMPYNAIASKGLLSKSSLPRYGCEPISEDVSVL